MPLLSCSQKPLHRLGFVTSDPIALAMHDSDVVLRIDIPALGQRTQFLHRRDKIAFPVSGIRRLPTRPCGKRVQGHQPHNADTA